MNQKTKATKIDLRCTPDQKETIKKLAEEAGETVSSYLLKMAISEKGQSLKYYREYSDIMTALLKELKRIGVNINQISTRLNSVEQNSLQTKESEKIRELFRLLIDIRFRITSRKW